MSVTNHGVWAKYTPDPWPEGLPSEVLFCKRNSDGVDWYTYFRTEGSFPANSVVLIAQQQGSSWVVVNATRDAERLFPEGSLVLSTVDTSGDDLFIKYIGKVWSGGEIVDKPVDLTAYNANLRWQKEVAGIAWNGHTIETDREASQPKLLAEFVAIVAGQRTDPSPWKFKDNDFVSLSNTDMQTVCLTARNYIAALYATEATVLAGITGGTVTTTAEIDEAYTNG